MRPIPCADESPSMNHRRSANLAEPLRYLSSALVFLAPLDLPATASDRPGAIRLLDSRFSGSVASASNGTLFVGSISEGGVGQIQGDGAVMTAVPKPGDHGTRSTFGLLADEERETRSVASNDATALGPMGPTTTERGSLSRAPASSKSSSRTTRSRTVSTATPSWAANGSAST